MNLIQELKNDLQGIALLRKWLGDGGETVPLEHANLRAGICASCPFNSKTGLELLKEKIGDAIRHDLELKHRLKLNVENEGSLHVCRVCSCLLSLKVWVPYPHIRAYTPDAQLAKFPKWCWIKSEK